MVDLARAKATLELFNERVDQIEGFRFIQSLAEAKSGFRIGWSAETGMIAERTGPDQEAIHATMTTYRLFGQDNDRISLHNLATVYASLPIDPDLV